MNPRPDFRFVTAHPAHFIAFGFGSGLAPVAPGTAGTLAALLMYWVLKPGYGDLGFLLVIALCFIAGIWACGRTGRDLGIADYGGMVWDEIVAFWLVLVLIPDELLWQGVAFALFRVFDIVKPPPIDYFDSTLKGGFGVMFDDIVAAFYTLLVIALWKFFVP
jgi:phosphatidylglycerophosphatase A